MMALTSSMILFFRSYDGVKLRGVLARSLEEYLPYVSLHLSAMTCSVAEGKEEW